MVSLNYRDPGTGDFVSLGGDGIPVGSIMGFGGSVAPPDWHLCDGSVHGSAELEALFGSPNTPDLRDKFIVGVSATKALGAMGGAASVTLTGAQSGSPAHAHGATSGGHSANHTHSATLPTAAGSHHHSLGFQATSRTNVSITDSSSGPNWPLAGTGSLTVEEPLKGHSHTGTSGTVSAWHTHAITVVNAVAANATASHENLPPYYSMVYIVKVA